MPVEQVGIKQPGPKENVQHNAEPNFGLQLTDLGCRDMICAYRGRTFS